MTPNNKRKKEETVAAVVAAAANGTERDGKRQCTAQSTTTGNTSRMVLVKQEPPDEATQQQPEQQQQPPVGTVSQASRVMSVKQEPSDAQTNGQNDDNNDDELPTSMELSKLLCRIVDTDKYSREEAIGTLIKLHQWLGKEDAHFLKCFYSYGGVIKVFDCITVTMHDVNCKGEIRSNCIGLSASVIMRVAYLGFGVTNKDIALKILISALDYGGLDILINASEEYTGGEDRCQLSALASVWFAFTGIFSFGSENIIISKDKAIAVFETGIDVLSHLKSISNVDGSILPRPLKQIFRTLRFIVEANYMTKDCIQNNSCISKCLDVFKKNDGTWNDARDVEETKATSVLFSCMLKKKLLNGGSDFEMIITFFVFALKQFGMDKDVRGRGIEFFKKSCSVVHDKNIIKQSGVMESLGRLLTLDDINEDEKNKIGGIIGTIAALVDPTIGPEVPRYHHEEIRFLGIPK